MVSNYVLEGDETENDKLKQIHDFLHLWGKYFIEFVFSPCLLSSL